MKSTDLKPESILRGYQHALITHLFEHDNTLARLPMGAGKTVCTLTAIKELRHAGHLGRVLIVAPLRVATLVWKQDAATWEHLMHMKVGIACGTPAQRNKAILDTDNCVVTINVENLPWVVEEGHLALFDGIVFDEITRFKAPAGKRLKAVEAAVSQVPWRVGLTGSIRPHHIEDVFAPMKLVTNARPLGKNITQFRRNYCTPDPYIRGRYTEFPGAAQLVAKAIAPWVYEITDAEYSAQLPELNIVRVPVQMPERGMAAYKAMRNGYLAEGVEAMQAATAVGKMQQITGGFLYDTVNDGAVVEIHNAKADVLREIAQDTDDNFLIAYWFEEDLRRIQAALNCPYIGSGVSTTEANKLIAAWNAGKIPHLAVHPASVGHGLNMQDGGHTIVWYTGVYSYDLHEQLIARLRRSGQKHSTITSMHLIAAEIDDAVLATALAHGTLQDIFVEHLRSNK